MNARSQLRILNIQGEGGIGSPGKKLFVFPQNGVMEKLYAVLTLAREGPLSF